MLQYLMDASAFMIILHQSGWNMLDTYAIHQYVTGAVVEWLEGK